MLSAGLSIQAVFEIVRIWGSVLVLKRSWCGARAWARTLLRAVAVCAARPVRPGLTRATFVGPAGRCALRPLRTVTIDIHGHTITAKPHLTDDAERILAAPPPVTG